MHHIIALIISKKAERQTILKGSKSSDIRHLKVGQMSNLKSIAAIKPNLIKL